MGVPFAIEQAATDTTRAKGLVIGDYAPRWPVIRPEWVQRSLRRPNASKKAVMGLQREAREIVLWDGLRRVERPVLVIRGGKFSSLLSEENADHDET